MNGSENSCAGAVFFTLVALGAILKVEDMIIGVSVAAVSTLLASICVRRAILQAAQTTEENHQRLEIQLQQLRSKLNENSSANTTAMDSIAATSETLRDFTDRLAEIDKLTSAATAIRDSAASLEENSIATNSALEKIADALQQQDETIKQVSDALTKFSPTVIGISQDLKKLRELQDMSRQSFQTNLKLLQVIGQILKNPSFAKDLEQMSSSLETLAASAETFDTMKNSLTLAQKDIFKIADASRSLADTKKYLGEIAAVSKNLGTSLTNTAADFTQATEEMRQEMSKLTTKLDAYNGLMRATVEQYTTLTEQDVRLLEKISEQL